MIIYRAFDEVFRSWSHVAVLRALLDTTVGFSGNETARVAGMHPLTALKALSSLEILGIIRRVRGGRDHIFTLNRDHWLVTNAILPFYNAERVFREEIFSSLQRIVRKSVMSAIVFGSVARKEEVPGSDFDLCCVVHYEKEKEAVREKLGAAAPRLHAQYGIKLAPVLFTISEFRAKSRTQLVKDILSEGFVISGALPKVLLR